MKKSKYDTSYKEMSKISDTKKAENLIRNHKRKIIYITFLILIILLFSLPFIYHNYMESKKTDSENISQYIEKLGKEFYENYYYPQLKDLQANHMIEDRTTFLKNFETTGIPVTLNRVIELRFKTEKEINRYLRNYQCDFKTTGFTVYPKCPYEKKSYQLEPHIVCQNLDLEKEED